MAARLLARRVALERGEDLGSTTGYRVRMENKTSSHTRIIYETDGILLRHISSDPLLSDIEVIIFDEFHERHLYGDILLALACKLQKKRPDLKIFVMSATLDTTALIHFLTPCKVLRSEGRTFPVEIIYEDQPLKDVKIWDRATDHCLQEASRTPGHILIFMPGVYEIQKTLDALKRKNLHLTHALYALHGELTPSDQDAAVEHNTQNKIIVSTNVAETSLTIEGVSLVIDSGFSRKSRFDPKRGINTLLIETISRSSADQRSGRAGRTGPGICVRLWTKSDDLCRQPFETPEIRSRSRI